VAALPLAQILVESGGQHADQGTRVIGERDDRPAAARHAIREQLVKQ